MARSILETVPKLLQAIWELEKELRSAAQNSVVLRRDEAKRHLSDARRHLDALLGLAQNAHADGQTRNEEPYRRASDETVPPPPIKD
ncbi:MAG TPA: hypothetical protein PKE16_05130 [Hyphomicrobium sp.]|nr:hypothetical protein [Hyphomicrobium sp.]